MFVLNFWNISPKKVLPSRTVEFRALSALSDVRMYVLPCSTGRALYCMYCVFLCVCVCVSVCVCVCVCVCACIVMYDVPSLASIMEMTFRDRLISQFNTRPRNLELSPKRVKRKMNCCLSWREWPLKLKQLCIKMKLWIYSMKHSVWLAMMIFKKDLKLMTS